MVPALPLFWGYSGPWLWQSLAGSQRPRRGSGIKLSVCPSWPAPQTSRWELIEEGQHRNSRGRPWDRTREMVDWTTKEMDFCSWSQKYFYPFIFSTGIKKTHTLMKSSKPWTNQLWALSHNITVFDLNNKKVN